MIGVGLGGYGIAQTTVLNGPSELTATSESDSDAPVTVIGGETLNALDGRQDVTISGSDTIFAAYARTEDILAWVGDASYNSIGFDTESQDLVSVTKTGTEQSVPLPAGSDLWLAEYNAEDELDMRLRLDEEFSILVVSDGTETAPSTVAITWPLDNRTPWAGPFMVGGALMLLLSLIFLVWAIRNQRRTRGPRRKSIKPPKSQRMPKLPRQRSYRVSKPKAVTTRRGRRSASRMIAMPALLIGSLVLSGCSSDLWPDLAGRDAIPLIPSPSASTDADAVAEERQPPAATVRQVQSIVTDVAEVAAAADASLDTEALSSRFDGPALKLRTGNYETRAKDSAFPALAPIPTGRLAVALPQSLPKDADTSWPRAIFAVVEPTVEEPAEGAEPVEPAAPVALMLLQASPREQYKVYYSVALEPEAVLPPLAPQTVGAPRLSPDTKLLSMAPGELAAAYVDVLTVGAESESYELFDIERDGLIPSVGVEARKARSEALDDKAKIEFGITPGDAETIALASNESGALVSIYIEETERVTPVEEGATINPEGATKTLSGLSGTKEGVAATYGDQLLFYIPPIGSDEKIVLLGFSQVLISAKEIK
ncbi:hypothetical protein BHD05_14305 [Marisediminicola antarctica]|uniref:DUF8094 domain-containing protein n=1 Tax=Marisediminicola antarctica TaxID=674079 RepID=A0A7L5ALI5_9MICO|nr:hypothetical protein BHD05_14305 [Marisediminicola antarctica]